MDQVDELLTDLMHKVCRLVGSAQSINIAVNLYNSNRLDWNVTIQQAGEDRIGFNKNKQFTPQGQ
jgi:hypothetical protein